jgi:hypothetical protein
LGVRTSQRLPAAAPSPQSQEWAEGTRDDLRSRVWQQTLVFCRPSFTPGAPLARRPFILRSFFAWGSALSGALSGSHPGAAAAREPLKRQASLPWLARRFAVLHGGKFILAAVAAAAMQLPSAAGLALLAAAVALAPLRRRGGGGAFAGCSSGTPVGLLQVRQGWAFVATALSTPPLQFKVFKLCNQ